MQREAQLNKTGKKGLPLLALCIGFFMVMDQVEKRNLKIECCPMDLMVADCMTKGLQGLKFGKFRKIIVGF